MKNIAEQFVKAGLALLFLASIIFVGGCDDTKITLTPKIEQSLKEVSLMDLWRTIAESTDIQERSAQMGTFTFQCDKDRNMLHLYFTFYGNNSKGVPHVYTASLKGDSRIDIRPVMTDSIIFKKHPAEVFGEIDKLGMDSLETNDEGLSILISFLSGDVGYGATGVYRLEDGELYPIQQVIFHSKVEWCTITVFHLLPDDGIVTTAEAPVTPETSSSQIWLLADDINRLAETVIYPDESRVSE
ncbi:MAG: hypothetical protein JW712_04935 [Dehalococcoidales bacterium]|nr:hypothetical protein [Dehalococcoidales bacterium]